MVELGAVALLNASWDQTAIKICWGNL